MALLQISEPRNLLKVRANSKKDKVLAAGIDLGTTYSLIATVRNGNAEIIPDLQNRYLLPSVVHYQCRGKKVGWEALEQASVDPINTIISVKRIIGCSLNEINKRYPNLPYHFITSDNGSPLIATSAGIITPVKVSSDILTELVERAKKTLNEIFSDVVITIPAYFNNDQRQATKDAAELAGLHVLRLLNEPTAAAIAYGLQAKVEEIIAVYDLGGGTFDISLLKLNKGVFEVLATGGLSNLGGDDFDQLLVNLFYKKIGLKNCEDQILQRKILEAAIEAKIILSHKTQTLVKIKNCKFIVTRKEFEILITPYIEQTLFICRRTLKDANLRHQDISKIIMVGGSTKLPTIRDKVAEFFDQTPLTYLDPEKIVALGAAIQANILLGNNPYDVLLLDVIPLSLGIETLGGFVEKIIQRNSTIPIIKNQEFTTFKDGQTTMMIHILQGEQEKVAHCRSIARFTLSGIPELPAGKARINVIFQLDADGLLSVTAIEKITGTSASVKVHPTYGLSQNELISMINKDLHLRKNVSIMDLPSVKT
ncbi:MAG: Fe-S protein assembly chaperone HscA [Candidatus Dasytiphilus stammeri]